MTKVEKMGVVEGGADAHELNSFLRGMTVKGRI
jgi:hypothetical protein